MNHRKEVSVPEEDQEDEEAMAIWAGIGLGVRDVLVFSLLISIITWMCK